MTTNYKSLSINNNDLTERQRKFEKEVVELREKMFQFKEDVMRKLDPAIEKSKPRPLVQFLDIGIDGDTYLMFK